MSQIDEILLQINTITRQIEAANMKLNGLANSYRFQLSAQQNVPWASITLDKNKVREEYERLLAELKASCRQMPLWNQV